MTRGHVLWRLTAGVSGLPSCLGESMLRRVRLPNKKRRNRTPKELSDCAFSRCVLDGSARRHGSVGRSFSAVYYRAIVNGPHHTPIPIGAQVKRELRDFCSLPATRPQSQTSWRTFGGERWLRQWQKRRESGGFVGHSPRAHLVDHGSTRSVSNDAGSGSNTQVSGVLGRALGCSDITGLPRWRTRLRVTSHASMRWSVVCADIKPGI